jgi:hypothetical protein
VLYLALVVSAALLLVVNLIAWKAEHPRSLIAGASILFGGASLGFLCVMVPPVLFQAILMGGVVAVWGAKRWRPAVFLMLSCTGTLLVYGVLGYFAYRQTIQLQQEHAYASLEDRLPRSATHHSGRSATAAAAERLNTLENLVDSDCRRGDLRTMSLRRLHEDTVSVFVNRPGFGVGRMTAMVDHFLKGQLRQEQRIPEPGTPSPSPWLPESLSKEPSTLGNYGDLFSLHEASFVDFVNPLGFGFVKDRQHIAGFQEHQFSQMQSPPPSWQLQRIDLIGLVVHKEPVVYVSDFLPRMDELRTAPTRTVDDFEAAGLRALERGEELFVRDRGSERRMLGAIRAVRQCLSCHDGERGDPLGAFAYRLTQ